VPACSGRVAGSEAVAFFTRSGLAREDLSKVWRLAKRAVHADGEGFTRDQFAVALRFISYAQVGGSGA
jgi:hypothetical protein